MSKRKNIKSLYHYLTLLGFSSYYSLIMNSKKPIVEIEELTLEYLLQIGIEDEEARNKILSCTIPCYFCTHTISIYAQKCVHCNKKLIHDSRFLTIFQSFGILCCGILLGYIAHYSYISNISIDEDIITKEETITNSPLHPRMKVIRKTHPIYGIDVSKYQGIIDWDILVKKRVHDLPTFVFIRSTAGIDNKDAQFDTNWTTLSNIDFIRRGAYHYYRPNENSTKQAQNFISNVTLRSGDLAPVLDIEVKSKVQSMDRLRTGLKNWLKIIEQHYNIRPIIYSSENFYKAHIQIDPELSSYPTWIASYSTQNLTDRMTWDIWQVSDKGSIEGINSKVDVNVIFDEKTLNKLILE